MDQDQDDLGLHRVPDIRTPADGVVPWAISSIAVQVWVALGLLSAGGGEFYSFGAFATDLKELGGYSQSEINTIGGLCYFFLCVQILVGLAAVRLPRTVVLASQAIATAGWFGLFGLTLAAPQPFLLVGACLSAVGFGVSSSPAAASQLAKRSLQIHPGYYEWTLNAYLVIYALSGGISAGIYALVATDANSKAKLAWFFAIAGFINLAALVAAAVWLRVEPPPNAGAAQAAESGTSAPSKEAQESTPLLSAAAPPPPPPPSPPTRAERIKTGCVLVLPPLLCLFLLFGSAVNFYNNASSMALSVGSSSGDVTGIFLVFCLGQVIGRFGAVYGRPEILRRADIQLLLASLILGVISVAAAVVNGPVLMYFYTVGNAVVYGSLWVAIFSLPVVLMPLLDLPFEIIYGFLCFAPGLGPLAFDRVSGWRYDRHADPTTHLCSGLECYRSYLILAAAFMVPALVLALFNMLSLWGKWRKKGEEKRKP